jgi:hypothetical protein
MIAKREFIVLAIADKDNRTWLGVCANLNDFLSVDGLKDEEGDALHFYNKAEYVPGWATDLGFRCIVTKRTIEVEIA